MELWKKETESGLVVRILYDDDPINPRTDYDHVGTLAIAPNRYFTGDDGASLDVPAGAISVPVYAYIHGGITLSDRPFWCPWDSGQIGVIYATKEKLAEHGIDPARAESVLVNEISEYSAYIGGECYRYEVEDQHGEIVDSCGGFVGCLEYVIDTVESELKGF